MATQKSDKTSAASVVSRPGVYARGADTVDAILKAALHVLIEEGASAFTLRRIADECGLKVGNVSRHFPRKEMLVQVLLEELLQPSEGLVERNIRKAGMSAEDGLSLVIQGSYDEIETKRMTHLFTELWAMANHNEFVAERVELAYRYMHDLIASFVTRLNPLLTPDEVQIVALFINTSIEGSTALAGFGKPWSAHMPHIKAIAARSLVQLAKSITSAEIAQLPPMVIGRNENVREASPIAI